MTKPASEPSGDTARTAPGEFPDVHLTLHGNAPGYALTSGNLDVTATFPRPAHHAPSGIAWGYHGSGPADLALLILGLHLPPGIDRTFGDVLRNAGFPPDPEEHGTHEDQLRQEDRLDEVWTKIEKARRDLPVRTSSGQYVSKDAWELHQVYKAEIIAKLDPDTPHVVRSEDVQRWLADNGTNDVRR